MTDVMLGIVDRELAGFDLLKVALKNRRDLEWFAVEKLTPILGDDRTAHRPTRDRPRQT